MVKGDGNMTQFERDRFETSGPYLRYDGKFVARFKHRGPVTKAKFIRTLVKHYTPAEYFARLDAGRAPLQVLMDDGILVFDHPNMKFTLDGKVL